MKKFKAIIVDDEPLARQVIKKYLTERIDIDILAECSDGFECLKQTAAAKPDIIFLDIQMPKINGFEVLEVMTEKPQIIFTTAFDEYAIKAFEMNAVDYLLKPFSKDRLFEAIDKCIERIKMQKPSENYLTTLPDTTSDKLSRVIVRNGNKVIIVPLDDIHYFESAENYVKIHSTSGNYLKEKTMKFYEQHLPKDKFLRLHRSYIVNLSVVISIEPYSKDSYIALLKNGEKLKVSQEGYKNFRKMIE